MVSREHHPAIFHHTSTCAGCERLVQVEVLFSKTLIWPDSCAYGNEPAQSFAESKHSTISRIVDTDLTVPGNRRMALSPSFSDSRLAA